MRKIGAFEARNNLSALLDAVARGEEILITRRGKPVAKLVRPTIPHDVGKAMEAVERIRQLRKDVSLNGDISLRGLIEEGRK